MSLNYHPMLHPSVGYYANVCNVGEGFYYEGFVVAREESAKVHFARPFNTLHFVNY